MEKFAAFLFVDIETTGLDPKTDQILQIGASCRDSDLNKICTVPPIEFEAVCKLDRPIEEMATVVKAMHGASGLLRKCRDEATWSEGRLMAEFSLWLTAQRNLFNAPVILAGSSIHFDRKFLDSRGLQGLLPDVKLSHRMLDVSSFKVWMNAVHPEAKWKPTKEVAHTALADIEASVEEMKHYATLIKIGVQENYI